MLANYLIGLREGLEAALVVSILIAYLVRTDRRDQMRAVWLGVAAAVGLAVGFGALMTYTETSLLSTGAAQETFGGTLSIVAVGFVTWMIFWMRSAGRGIGRELQGRLDTAVAVGSSAVVLMAFIAVAREGLETALFLFSAVQAAGTTAAPLSGFVLGLTTAVVLAGLLYRRAVTINLSRFFTVTGLLLIFVAAGVLAYGVHDLQEGGVLPGLDHLAFDVSSTVPPASWYGTLLKGVLNFSPQTTVLQAVAWVAYVVPVLFLFLRGTRSGGLAAASATTVVAVTLASCAAASTAGSVRLAVKATDASCELGSTQLSAGTVTFEVQNLGSQLNEFYVYDHAGATVVAEVENVGPGLTRELTAQLAVGSYVTACKPGGTGDGIRGTLTVTAGSAAPTADTAALAAAVTRYQAFVATEAAALLTGTKTFVAAVKRGHVAAAKSAYPAARVHWERIEPVAESFGDLDPKIDARENDLEPGAAWTGWHRLEKELWLTGLSKDASALADRLLTDTRELVSRVATVTLTPAQLGNGAKELLDEVATSKVTGEEERYSHLDLWDFAANVEGARQAFEALRPVAQAKAPALVRSLDVRFAALEVELATFREGEGYVLYSELGPAQVKTLSGLVDALSEPLSRLTVAVVG